MDILTKMNRIEYIYINLKLFPLDLKIYRTEFQMKFLWGSKGSLAPAFERHTKLEQILSLMAEKFCGGSNLTLNGSA